MVLIVERGVRFVCGRACATLYNVYALCSICVRGYCAVGTYIFEIVRRVPQSALLRVCACVYVSVCRANMLF